MEPSTVTLACSGLLFPLFRRLFDRLSAKIDKNIDDSTIEADKTDKYATD